MESIGERLKNAREQKGYDLEQIARETNIVKRYLIALENEDFQVFPGEPYLIGFLRNYADYLGLDPKELIHSYKNLKIQEQPIPVQQLLERDRKSPLPFIIAAAIAVVCVGAGVWLLMNYGKPVPGTGGLASGRIKQEYTLESLPFEKRLFEGDAIIYLFNTDKYKLILDSIGDAVTVKTPSGDVRILLGEEAAIDLDKNGFPELKAFVSEYSKTDATKGAVVKFDSISEAQVVSAAAGDLAVGQGDASSQIPKTDNTQLDTTKAQILIEAKSTPYPFTMNVIFRGHCMFRYEIDRKERDERYYRKGEQIAASANNVMKIWLSNATSCVIQVVAAGRTANVEVGGSGEVVVKQIKWVQNEAGNFILAAYNVN